MSAVSANWCSIVNRPRRWCLNEEANIVVVSSSLVLLDESLSELRIESASESVSLSEMPMPDVSAEEVVLYDATIDELVEELVVGVTLEMM